MSEDEMLKRRELDLQIESDSKVDVASALCRIAGQLGEKREARMERGDQVAWRDAARRLDERLEIERVNDVLA